MDLQRGPGLMTRMLRRFCSGVRVAIGKKNDGDRLDLGFCENRKDDSSLTNANESWVPLIENVRSFNVRYFDARLKCVGGTVDGRRHVAAAGEINDRAGVMLPCHGRRSFRLPDADVIDAECYEDAFIKSKLISGAAIMLALWAIFL